MHITKYVPASHISLSHCGTKPFSNPAPRERLTAAGVRAAAKQDMNRRDIRREDALGAFGPAMTQGNNSPPAPHSDLSIFQNTGVAGPSSTPERDLRQALGWVYSPSGM